MTYLTLHTRHGLRRLSQAEATGTPLVLSHMAVGDGAGNPVEPHDGQTQLVRERYRAAVNRVYPSPTDPTLFTAELVIPASVGGFVLREFGVFDDLGSLCLVGNLPDGYKPENTEGAFADTVLRCQFVVANGDAITVQIDPNVAVATHSWVINNVTAQTVIPGGTTGQLLAKKSNADGDTHWINLDDINVTVDTIAEKQVLAADQTIVDLAVTTTYGLAVYIDGLRIDLGSAAGEWQPDESLSTRLHLGQSYPAGTRITLVQNEPAGSAGAPLERSKNLSDVQDKATARSNLDIFSKDETRQMAPPGMVAHFARSTAPAGWLKANGASVSRVAYAELFAAIGTTYGAGDGFTTFNLPDLRGEFIRGWDDGRGVDGGRELGAVQSGAIQSHTHAGSSTEAGSHVHSGSAQPGGAHSHQASSGAAGAHSHTLRNYDYGGFGSGLLTASDAPAQTINTNTAGEHTHPISVGNAGDHTHSLSINSAGTHKHAVTIDASGGAETRPRNVALLACVKF